MAVHGAINTAVLRLQKDFQRIQEDPVPFIRAVPHPSNILEWSHPVSSPCFSSLLTLLPPTMPTFMPSYMAFSPFFHRGGASMDSPSPQIRVHTISCTFSVQFESISEGEQVGGGQGRGGEIISLMGPKWSFPSDVYKSFYYCINWEMGMCIITQWVQKGTLISQFNYLLNKPATWWE